MMGRTSGPGEVHIYFIFLYLIVHQDIVRPTALHSTDNEEVRSVPEHALDGMYSLELLSRERNICGGVWVKVSNFLIVKNLSDRKDQNKQVDI